MPLVTPKPVKAWPDSNGTLHTTIEGWRVAELFALLKICNGSADCPEKALEQIANDLAQGEAETVLAILTTGPRSRPAVRKRAGTTNPRRATKAQAKEGFKAIREAATAGGTNSTHDADVPATGEAA